MAIPIFESERARASNMIHRSVGRVASRQVPVHYWVVTGTINSDLSLSLDEAPGEDQRLYTYTLADFMTEPLTTQALNPSTAQAWTQAIQNQQDVADAALNTYDTGAVGDALHGRECLQAGDLTHSHLFALPPSFAAPQPKDRVLVLMQRTRTSPGIMNDGPEISAHILWRLRTIKIRQRQGD